MMECIPQKRNVKHCLGIQNSGPLFTGIGTHWTAASLLLKRRTDSSSSLGKERGLHVENLLSC